MRMGIRRQAAMWKPCRSGMWLPAVRRPVRPGGVVAQESASDPAEMHALVTGHWGPVFQALDTDEVAAGAFCREWCTRLPHIDLLPPGVKDFEAFWRPPRSAPQGRMDCRAGCGRAEPR